jgi:hypothetical protein
MMSMAVRVTLVGSALLLSGHNSCPRMLFFKKGSDRATAETDQFSQSEALRRSMVQRTFRLKIP